MRPVDEIYKAEIERTFAMTLQQKEPTWSQKIHYTTTAEAANVLGRNERTIRRWIESGKLPSIKRQGQRYIVKAEVDRLRASMPELASPLSDRIADLENRVCTLTDQIESMQELKNQVQHLQEQLAALSQRLDERPGRSHTGRPRLSGAEKRGMPAGTMRLVEFARSHGLAVSDIKLLYWSKKIELTVHRRTGEVVRNKQEWWITPEQHRALIAYALQHDMPCHCCDWCASAQATGLSL